MLKKAIFLILCQFMGKYLKAQHIDTLIFTDLIILAKVKEVTPEIIAYQLPGKDILYKLSKTNLIKINYGDGHAEESPWVKKLPLVGTEDWRTVSIASNPEEANGLYKIEEIIINGSIRSRNKDDALRMKAAMMGGNVVKVSHTFEYTSTRYTSYTLTPQRRNPIYYSSPRTTVNERIKANVYTSKPPDSVAFRNLLKKQPTLSLVSHSKLRTGLNKYKIRSEVVDPADAKILKYTVEDHNIFVWLSLRGFENVKFHLNYFDGGRIVLSFQKNDWGSYHTIFLLIKPNFRADHTIYQSE